MTQSWWDFVWLKMLQFGRVGGGSAKLRSNLIKRFEIGRVEWNFSIKAIVTTTRETNICPAGWKKSSLAGLVAVHFSFF